MHGWGPSDQLRHHLPWRCWSSHQYPGCLWSSSYTLLSWFQMITDQISCLLPISVCVLLAIWVLDQALEEHIAPCCQRWVFWAICLVFAPLWLIFWIQHILPYCLWQCWEEIFWSPLKSWCWNSHYLGFSAVQFWCASYALHCRTIWYHFGVLWSRRGTAHNNTWV